MFRVFKGIKLWLTDWCLSKQDIQIGQLHDILQINDCNIFNDGELKFIEQSTPSELLVETPTGYSPIKHTHKTVKYDTWYLKTENNELFCADEHIVIDYKGNECYVQDLRRGDLLQTKGGIERILSVDKTNNKDHMYDLELDDSDHVYYTNNILSHNSITSAAYLLWYAMFNFDKTILIAANKNSNAMEMILRIRYAYEELPMWIKPGITEDGWNKHTVIFDNGSRIESTATSADSGRGMSISLLFLDEFGFVKPNIQDEFWTSISPTLSTGGSAIITSTPNGDLNIYAQIWRSALAGNNGFYPIHVKWNEPPGRDEEFKEDCIFLSSDSLLIDSLFLTNLTPEIDAIIPKITINDVVMFDEIRPHKTYLLGVDPATGAGEDFSVITIYSFPELIQVGEYRSNTMSTKELYTAMKNILKYMEDKGASIYFSIENNGVGQGLIALYEADENPLVIAEFISEPGKDKLGFTTTARSKMRACVNFKEMLEKRLMYIKSKMLLSELKSYVRAKGAYAAQTGATDDCVAATLIIMRLVEEISTYEQQAFDKLYSGKIDEWGSEEWDGYEEEYDDGDEGLPMVL